MRDGPLSPLYLQGSNPVYLQGSNPDSIADLFDVTEFWDAIAADPFRRSEWREAIRQAPTMKDEFYTILSIPDRLSEAERHLTDDPRLARCVRD